MYKHILESHYGAKVRDLSVVALHPEAPTFQELPVPSYYSVHVRKLVDYLLRQRMDEKSSSPTSTSS